MTHIISNHILTTPVPSSLKSRESKEEKKPSMIAAVISHGDIKQTAITRENKRAAKNTAAS